MKKRVFLDTNVMLDILGEREIFYDDAARILSLSDEKKLTAFTSVMSYPTIYYLLSKYEKESIVRSKLVGFKSITETCELTNSILEHSLMSSFKDVEDAIQYYSALDTNCDVLITRNEKDFKNAVIPIQSPKAFLSSLKN